MTVETDIFIALKSLVGNRVYENFAPLGTPRPFIVYEHNGGEALSFLDGALPDKKHGIFEISVYSDDRLTRTSIALQVESAMAAQTAFVSAAITSQFSAYAQDVKIYSSTQNFSIYSTR